MGVKKNALVLEYLVLEYEATEKVGNKHNLLAHITVTSYIHFIILCDIISQMTKGSMSTVMSQ